MAIKILFFICICFIFYYFIKLLQFIINEFKKEFEKIEKDKK